MKLWKSLKISIGSRHDPKTYAHDLPHWGQGYELDVFKSQTSLSTDSGLCTERGLRRTHIELIKSPGQRIGLKLAGLQAKEKWKNLRSVFVRNLKPPASGSSKKKKYYLTDAMQFALPYIKSAGIPSGSLPNLNNQDDEPQASTPPPISPPPLASPPPSVSPPPPTSPTASSSHQTDRTSTPLSISSQRQRRKNKISENDKLFNDYLKTKLSKQNDVNNESTNNNANKMFLLSLLPDLNCMTSTQIRSFKRQVIDVIDNILNVPHTSPTQTPVLLHIPNTSSASSSQITTGIEMPNNNMIQCTTNDGLNETTYIHLLQNTMGEVNYTQN